jgi:hypothetical protein
LIGRSAVEMEKDKAVWADRRVEREDGGDEAA